MAFADQGARTTYLSSHSLYLYAVPDMLHKFIAEQECRDPIAKCRIPVIVTVNISCASQGAWGASLSSPGRLVLGDYQWLSAQSQLLESSRRNHA